MKWQMYLFAILYLTGSYFILAHIGQADFYLLFPSYTLVFMSYVFLALKANAISVRMLMTIGGAAHVLPLFFFPGLSDDIYRFYWDGVLWSQGIHPFDYLPSELMRSSALMTHPSLPSTYDLLNSKDYYSIYPPVCQLVFFAVSNGIENIQVTGVLLKLVYAFANVMTAVGLFKIFSFLRLSIRPVFVYFLNPLIIIELVGNLHAEVMMVCFLVWMFYFLLKEEGLWAGIFYALAIATKIHPLALGPLLMVYVYRKKMTLSFCLSSSITLFSSYLILLKGSDLTHLLDSVSLYFDTFEFNASLYYFLRGLGYWKYGYNLIGYIGPSLAVISLVAILMVALRVFNQTKWNDYRIDFLFYSGVSTTYLIYLIFSTTIHPWYLAPCLAFALLDKRLIWVTVIWSYLVFLSYSAYDSSPFQEHMTFITIEYGSLLVVAIYVLKNFDINTLRLFNPTNMKT